MSYFHNKRIWVTGASSGIGRSVAIKLSKLGAEVILTARNRDKLEEVKKECGNAKAHIFDHDLSKLESIDDLVDRVTREVGSIDILFNNVGVSAYSAANETDFNVYTQVMNLNFLSVVKLTKCLLPQMISNKKGQIVTNTSLSGNLDQKKELFMLHQNMHCTVLWTRFELKFMNIILKLTLSLQDLLTLR